MKSYTRYSNRDRVGNHQSPRRQYYHAGNSPRRTSNSRTKRSDGYRDSNLQMCFEVTRDVATEIYDYAGPKLIQGIASVRNIQLMGPECGTSARGNRRKSKASSASSRRTTSSSKRKSRLRSPSLNDDSIVNSSCSSDTPTAITKTKTFDDIYLESRAASADSHTTQDDSCDAPYDSSDTMSEGSRRTRRSSARGRSPTFRSHSVNSKDARASSNAATGPELPERDTSSKDGSRSKGQGNQDHYDATLVRACPGPAPVPLPLNVPVSLESSLQPRVSQMQYYQRRHSSAEEYDAGSMQGKSHSVSSGSSSGRNSIQSHPHYQRKKQPLTNGSFRQTSNVPDVEQSICDFISVKSSVQQFPETSGQSSDLETVPKRNDRAVVSVTPSDGKDLLVAALESLPLQRESDIFACLTDCSPSEPYTFPSPRKLPQSSARPTKEMIADISEHQSPPAVSMFTATAATAETATASETRGNIDDTPAPIPVAEKSQANVSKGLKWHKLLGNDVTIIVGQGQHQKTFLHNAHVLLYISEYFSQVMVPDVSRTSSGHTQGRTSSTLSTLSSGPGEAWIIDFSHKKVKEWEMFYPFLEPPVKRTVSVDVYNLPTLLPWFHEFHLSLLLHQCDVVLSSLSFRHVAKAQISDLQDVLLLLYAALSCDLPLTQDLGIRVIQSYLKSAPHLFLHNSLNRFIILMQCFPHFQQHLWFSAIQSYMPPDLSSCCDVDTPTGRDALVQNPLFRFLLRDGLIKAQEKAKTRPCLSNKNKTWTSAASLKQMNSMEESSSTTQKNSGPAGSQSASSENRVEDVSGIFSMSTGNSKDPSSTSSSLPSSASPVSSEEDVQDTSYFEMSYALGVQFWGPGWNEEPRLSAETVRRHQDRHRWLEDIVEKLKAHFVNEQKKEEQKLQEDQETSSQRHQRKWETNGTETESAKNGVKANEVSPCFSRPPHTTSSRVRQLEQYLKKQSSKKNYDESPPGSCSPDLTASTMSPTSLQSATNLQEEGRVSTDSSLFSNRTFSC